MCNTLSYDARKRVRITNSKESPYNVDVQFACSLARFPLLHLSDPAGGRCGRVALISCVLVSVLICASASFKLTVADCRLHLRGMRRCGPAWTDSLDLTAIQSMEDLIALSSLCSRVPDFWAPSGTTGGRIYCRRRHKTLWYKWDAPKSGHSERCVFTKALLYESINLHESSQETLTGHTTAQCA